MQTIRLLFWLKRKLILRGYRRNTSLLVGAMVLLLLFLPVAISLAFAAGLGFMTLSPPDDGHLLRGVLLGIYAWWLLSPMLGYAFNDAYDISKLFVFPISLRTIFLGAILGSLLDVTTWLMLPTLIAALLGFSSGIVSGLFNAVVLLCFLFHTLSLSLTIILVSAGVLRSRRFRDGMVILFSLFGTAYFLVTQSLTRNLGRVNWKAITQNPLWEVVNYLPSGLAARALETGKLGLYPAAIGYLVALGGVTVATFYLASLVIQKVYSGEAVLTASGGRKAKPEIEETVAVRPGAAPSRLVGRKLPPVVQATMDKELKYLARDPYFRLVLSNFLYLVVVAIFAFATPLSKNEVKGFGTWALHGASGMLLMQEMSLVCNIFGTEGGAVTLLFLFPAPRRQIILGKNLAMFTVLSGINLVFTLIVCGFAQAFEQIAYQFVWIEFSLLVLMAMGNLASIYAPYRMVMRGWRVRQQSASRGCAYSLLYFLMMLIGGVILIPVLAAFVVPTAWVGSGWLALTLPLALLYAGGLYAFSLYMAEPLLRDREQAITAKVSQED